MARPQATPEQRAELRKRIQRAAADIYNQEGIAAITARAVAKQAGVSVGTIYSHFEGLPQLMQSLWTGHVERFEVSIRSLAQNHLDPVQRLEALLKAYIEFGTANADLYKGAFMFVRPAGLDQPDPDPVETTAFGALLADAIDEGQHAGQIRAGDGDALAQFLWASVHGCLALPVNFDRLAMAPAKQMAGDTVAWLLAALRS